MTEDKFYTVTQAAKVLSITNRRVRQLAQEGRIEAERTDEGWKLFRSSVHAFRDEKRTAGSSGETLYWPPEAMEALEKVNTLERELGRFEGRLELEAVARSTLEAQLLREQERADQERIERLQAQEAAKELSATLEEENQKLRESLQAEQSKGFWQRLFGKE